MKLIACICLAIAAYQSIAAQATVPPVLPSYELYSWQAKDGAWNYSLIVSPSGASVSEETIFDRKSRVQGTGVLEAKLAKLIPVRTYIGSTDYPAATPNQLACRIFVTRRPQPFATFAILPRADT